MLAIEQTTQMTIRSPGRIRWRRLAGSLALGYGLVLPALVLLSTFTYVPAVLVALISLYHWNLAGFGASEWVGLLHYEQLLNPISGFLQSLTVTAYYSGVMVPATIGFGLLLAWLLQGSPRRKTPGLALFRAAVFLPYVTPTIATSIVWVFIFNPQFGLANAILTALHLPALQWLTSTTWAMPAVMINNLWHNLGFSVVLFLAGLANVPPETMEAAQLDGANSAQTFWHVVLPLLSPVLLFVVIVTTIQSMQTFGPIYAMTGGQFGGGGGPLGSTTTTAVYLYKSAFIDFHYSYGAAVSVVLFLIIFILTMIQHRLGERFTFYQ